MRFAVIKTGGKQYKVSEGDVLEVEKLVTKDGQVEFDQVLLLADGDKATVGKPLVSGAKVSAKVLEEGKGESDDLETLSRHCQWLGPGNTYCALAPGAVEPLQSALKYFREDFERHITQKRCPWR